MILGAGESGIGAAILAKKQGWMVFVSDMGSIKDEFKQEMISQGIEFEEGKHDQEKIFKADLNIVPFG